VSVLNFQRLLQVTVPVVDEPANAISSLLSEDDGDEQDKAQKGIATLSLLGNNFATNISASNKTKVSNNYG
jgi:hypothetical protein